MSITITLLFWPKFKILLSINEKARHSIWPFLIVKPMTPTQLFEDIHNFCFTNSNEEIVKKYARYFKEGYDAFGNSQELFLQKIKEITENKALTIELVYQTAPLLIKTGKYEETSFAIVLLKHFHKTFDEQTFHHISSWFDIGIENWAHNDVICSELLSVLLLKKNMPYTHFKSWRESERRFKRRAVPVALIKLLKKTEDFVSLFNFLEPLMKDNERVVHQGMGWFLREAWKIQPTVTEEFLLKWKDTAPRLIFQTATEKMSPIEKERFRKTK